MSYVSNKFIRNILQTKPKWGPIGEIVYLRTYSRWLAKHGRRERWDETVRRVVDYSVSLDETMPENARKVEAEKLFDVIYNLRAFPAGRTLWVGGTEHSKTHGQSQFNCSFTNISSVEDLHDLVILLMNGVGVGVGVRDTQVKEFAKQGVFNPDKQVFIKQYEYIGKVGTGKDTHTDGDSIYFTIHDSREGWATFVKDFMQVFLFGHEFKHIHINTDHIRPEGTPLKTFGGRASGPGAIIDFINGIIFITEGLTEVTDLLLLDTANLLGRMVVAGGTRRSALIALGDPAKDPDDKQTFESSKTGNWYDTHIWRSQANNSVVYYSKPDRQSLEHTFEKILQFGEPGFINGMRALQVRPDWQGINPCFTGDMRLLTNSGYVTFKEAYDHGMPLKVVQDARATYNGDEVERPENWIIDVNNTDEPVVTQASRVFLTRQNADIVKLTFKNGSVLRCTPDHLVATTSGMVEAQHLTSSHDILVYGNPYNIGDREPSSKNEHASFLEGYIAGAFSYYLYKDGPGFTFSGFYDEAKVSMEALGASNSVYDTFYISQQPFGLSADRMLGKESPIEITDVLWYLRGYMSCKARTLNNGSLRIQDRKRGLRNLLLTVLDRFDIKYTSRKVGKAYFEKYEEEVVYEDELFETIVHDTQALLDLVGLSGRVSGWFVRKHEPKTSKLVSIMPDGVEDVYCIKEDSRRALISEGIVAKRCAEIILPDKGFCNLVTTNLAYFADNPNEYYKLEDTLRTIVRHNLRITNTTIHGVSPIWDEIQKRDRLLGVSFTGYGDHVDVLGREESLETLANMKQWATSEANRYADQMGIPRPLLVTTVKPEGTITLLYGASSGIHDAYAPYYIRRVSMSRTDALAITLAQMGVPVEDSRYAPNTVIFSFPVKSNATQSAASKTAIEQLDRYKDIMKAYVQHNASNTIYIQEKEVPEIIDWLLTNWDEYLAVSFLVPGTYEQAPMEEIDEATYIELKSKMPDLQDLHARLAEVEYEMTAGDDLEGCDTGSCPVR